MEKLLDSATQLDREDVLGPFRDQFFIPRQDDGSPQHYFCGHSLGLQAHSVESVVQQELHAWRELAVRGHFEGDQPWMDCSKRLSGALAELVGASPSELVVMNTLSVNLHLLMVSFYQPHGKRCKILIEKHAFPSDRYAVESQLRFHGLDPAENLVELEPADGGLGQLDVLVGPALTLTTFQEDVLPGDAPSPDLGIEPVACDK